MGFQLFYLCPRYGKTMRFLFLCQGDPKLAPGLISGVGREQLQHILRGITVESGDSYRSVIIVLLILNLSTLFEQTIVILWIKGRHKPKLKQICIVKKVYSSLLLRIINDSGADILVKLGIF